ncbi:hypothetical protein DESC_700247 [Desulfosarcina cetonica]|nr:hypothetical protein DESC_700247 [Desulfosarcina cetonica]
MARKMRAAAVRTAAADGSDPFFLYQAGEMLEAAVKGPFSIVGEDAGRQLSHANVVFQAITAHTFAGTRFVRAIATIEIAVLFTFHATHLLSAQRLRPPRASP